MKHVFTDPDDGTQLDEEKRQQLLQMIAFVGRAADIVEGEFTPVIEDGLREAYEQQRPDHL